MTLMLLDSGSLWYRAYYGMPDTLTADDGTPVNAIRGFLDMSARLISAYNPDRMVVCLDGDGVHRGELNYFRHIKLIV